MGFQPFQYRGLETGEREVASHAIIQGKVGVVGGYVTVVTVTVITGDIRIQITLYSWRERYTHWLY